MEFWQYPLAFIVAMLMALFVGISGAYLIIRFIYKDDRFPLLKLHVLLFRRNPGVLILGGKARQITVKSNPPLKISEPPEFPIPELLVEFEHNRKIAAELSDDIMLPLHHNVWDTHQYSSHELPANLLIEIGQVYADVKLLNKLVWLSTELGCQSSSLHDYKNLLARIVEKTNQIEEAVSLGIV